MEATINEPMGRPGPVVAACHVILADAVVSLSLVVVGDPMSSSRLLGQHFISLWRPMYALVLKLVTEWSNDVCIGLSSLRRRALTVFPSRPECALAARMCLSLSFFKSLRALGHRNAAETAHEAWSMKHEAWALRPVIWISWWSLWHAPTSQYHHQLPL